MSSTGNRFGTSKSAALATLTALACLGADGAANRAEVATPIRIIAGDTVIDATLNDGPTALDFVRSLPLTIQMTRWGEREYYGKLRVRLSEQGRNGIEPASRADHETLFQGYVSTLAVTDPEFIAYFDDFAFDEVVGHGSVDVRTRLMVQLASMIAVPALREYRMMLGAALTVGVTPVEIKEIVYQAVPYVGMAKVFDFLHATNEVLVERGVELPLPGQSTTTPETRLDMGLAAVDKLYASAPADELHLQRYLSNNCFGDHYTRTGLDVPTRDLLTFSMLAALGGCDAQVKGHLAANLHVGNDRARLIDVLTQLLPFIGHPRTLNALRAIDEVTAPAPAAG